MDAEPRRGRRRTRSLWADKVTRPKISSNIADLSRDLNALCQAIGTRGNPTLTVTAMQISPRCPFCAITGHLGDRKTDCLI